MIEGMHADAQTSVNGDYVFENGKRPNVRESYKYDASQSSSEGEEAIALQGVRRKKNVTMTQLDMEELKVEMNTFKENLRLKNDEGKKPAALSDNRLKIQAMRKELEELKDEMRDRDSDSKEEIDSLKKKLKERESDEGLYYDSLQHDFELDRRSLYSELYEEKKKGRLLELKNEQITRMFRKKLKEDSEAKFGESTKKRKSFETYSCGGKKRRFR